MGTAVSVSIAVLACIGFMIYLIRQGRKSALLDIRRKQVKTISEINKEAERVDEATNEKLKKSADPANDPRSIWMRDSE